MNAKINHLAVWILVGAAQLIGGVWYAIPVIVEKWLSYHGKTLAEVKAQEADYSPFVVSIIAAIVLNYALAWLFRRLNIASAVAGLKIALICWFAFLFMDYATIEAFSAFGRNYCQIIFIDMGRTLLVFALGGLVLGAWQKRAPAVAGQ